ETAFGRGDSLLADIGEAILGFDEAGAPAGLDRAARGVLDHLGDALDLAGGDLGEGVLDRLGGAAVAVALEGHVGEAAVRGDTPRLALGALERRHIGRSGFVGDFKLAHGTPSIDPASGWHR